MVETFDRSSVDARAGAPRVPRSRSRLRFALWTIVASTVLMELTLQLGAFAVWAMERKPVPALSAGENVVLCVGDSWTQGMGTTDPATRSYPSVVQELLRARTGQKWTVVNGGSSGQNSRDVLERLPSQLAQFRPRLVCVLVGQNDFWSMPALLDDAGGAATVDHSAYRFRWRIPRLAKWVVGKFSGAGQVVAAARTGDEWKPRTLTVAEPYRTEPATWGRNSASTAVKRDGWQLAAAKDQAGALRRFEEALALEPEDPQTRQMLVGLHHASHNDAAMKPHLEWLVAAWQREPGYWNGRCLVVALETCGRWQDALDVAVPFLAKFPLDSMTWRYRAQLEFFLGLHDVASRSIEEAIRLGPDPWDFFWRYKIWFLGRKDIDEAIRSIFEGYEVFNDSRKVEEQIRALSESEPSRIARAIELAAVHDCDPAVRERLGRITGEVKSSLDGAAATAVLAGHLERIAVACRNSGAEPVLLSYPDTHPSGDVLRRAAQDIGAEFVDVRTLFDARRGDRSWASLRAPDGHCNDDGYRLMAEIVTDALVQRFAPK